MAVDKFNSRFNARDDIQVPLTPHNQVQRDITAPAGEWRPARWLPIAFSKSDAAQGTDYFVISSGKAVAFDTEGRIVPAGLRTKLKAGASALAYTATDAAQGVQNLVTGATVSGAVTYSTLQVALALLNRGLVREQDATDASLTVPPTNNSQGEGYIELFISKAIGFVPYDVYVYAGTPERGDQWFTNYNKQHLIAFWTECQLKVPQLAATEVTGEAFDAATLDGSGSHTYVTGSPVQAGQFWNAANVSQLSRYSSVLTSSSPVVALGLARAQINEIAANTTRTPFECDTDGVLVRQRTGAGEISKAGDWFLDTDVGVLFLHEDTWATLVADSASPEFSYSYYSTTAADGHKFIHFDGPCRPGDFVAVDAQSNYRVATAAEVAACDFVGRVLEVQTEPRGYLDKVKTAWNYTGVSKTAQTPGTATGGFSDLITLSDETVANHLVILSVRF